MKLIPDLYIRSWIAKLHPPVLTTPQENQRLLSVLRSSFQRRLDNAHPPLRPTKSNLAGKVPASGPSVDNDSANATTHHLRSMLQHPLLARTSNQQTENQHAAAIATGMMDQVMVQDKADLKKIGRCLDVYSPVLSDKTSTVKEEFRLGEKLSAWYMSSDSATKHRFLDSTSLLRRAVPIMYADGQEEVVWEWLRMLYARRGYGEDSQWQNNASTNSTPLPSVVQECHLTFFMIREALRKSQLDAAVLHLVKACDYMQRTGGLSSEARSSEPWQSATKAVTTAILGRRQEHGLSDHLFDSLLAHRSMWSDGHSLIFDLISIYHPSLPSTESLARTVGRAEDRAEARFDAKDVSKGVKNIVLIALLDAADMMLRQQNANSVRQARPLLTLIEVNFPNVAGMHSNGITQKRIRSFRRLINPEGFTLPSAEIT